jgi:hypothetical protein
VNGTGREREPGHASWRAAALLLQERDAGSLGREGIEWEEAYEERGWSSRNHISRRRRIVVEWACKGR